MAAYIPAKGDLIAVTFDPQSGHEQKGRRPGRRPALVISNDLFNQRTGLTIGAKFIEKIPGSTLNEVLSILDACIY
jgi:mRNA-degrading endonuclease toxin of MazEF toxin-antitoxin module